MPHALATIARPSVPAVAAWTPASLTNVVEWWDFSDTSKITASSNLVSDVATSLSSGGHSLTQGTGSAQPLTATDTINSRNVLKFDGTASYMATSNITTAQPCTILAVAKNAGTGQRDLCMFGTDGRIYRRSAGNIGMFAITHEIDSGVAWGTTNAHQVVVALNGAGSSIYVDGGAATTGDPGSKPDGTGSPFYVGRYLAGGEFWSGDIAEIAVTSSAISSGDRTSWNTYCARWGL